MTAVRTLTRVASDVGRRHATLRLYGPGDVDCLDPAASDASAGALLRLLSRQLVTYEPQPDLRQWQAGTPVPDVAVEIPSTYNMGLGASHRGHVLHLRPDVLWDTTPVRPVTAHDFVRGFKRMGNPVARSSHLTYFTSTIRGMAEFCAAFAAAVSSTEVTALEVAAYQNAHDIPGVFALDDETLVIEVVRPTPDFVYMLALPCASAAPAEYDAYVPGSRELRLDLRSNGPYRVAHYVPGRNLTLEQNPAWRRESDPVRRRRVERVEITVEKTSPGQIAARIDAGEADLPWGSPLARRPVDRQTPVVYALDPYLVFNVAGGARALRDVRVRRAVAIAVDKAALADVYRRAADVDVRVAGSIVPPNNDAHDDLARADGPDPEGARALLAEAGYGDGLTLIAGYRDRDVELEVARSYAADLEKAGVVLRVVRLDDDAAASWDVMARSWSADWTCLNGRVFLQPLFETGASANYGGYSSSEVDELVKRALEAAVEHPQKAAAAWGDVERKVLDDVAVVPLLFRVPGLPRRSDRVRNAFPVPAYGYAYDIASVNDIAAWFAGADRDVERRPLSGGEGHAVVLRRSYDASVEDLWGACTEPAQLETWLLSVSGDLRPGGTYQFEGNAGGDILECEEPHLVRVSWVHSDGPASEVVLRLSPAGDGGATLELEHAAPVEGGAVPEFVLGVGPRWDPALVALALHLRGELPEDKGSWAESPEVRQLIEGSVRAWAAVLNERGIASPSVVARAADASLAFYMGGERSSEG